MRVEPNRDPFQQVGLLSRNGLTLRFQEVLRGVNMWGKSTALAVYYAL